MRWQAMQGQAMQRMQQAAMMGGPNGPMIAAQQQQYMQQSQPSPAGGDGKGQFWKTRICNK